MSRSANDILDEWLTQLLPTGAAWPKGADSNLASLLRAMAEPRAQLEADLSALQLEISPRTSVTLLADYEATLGPDPCGRDASVTTIEARQALAYQRWVTVGDNTIDGLIAMAAATGVAITIDEPDPAICGEAVCDIDVCSQITDRFVWAVSLPDRASHMQCMLNQRSPADTAPAFSYRSDDGDTSRFHLTPPAGTWMNDTQRPIWINGQWVLWYLWNGDFPSGGGTAWRRAVSTDLVTWQDAGVSIPKYTTPYGDIWTGSAVIDTQNTAGFGAGVVIAMVTMPWQGQSVARWVSKDAGATFAFDQIVMSNDQPLSSDAFRDPKVFWHAGTGRWIMTLAELNEIQLYGSADLKTWSKLSSMARTDLGVLECPDLFPLHLYDSTGAVIADKWVMFFGANGFETSRTTGACYVVGAFDGTTFTPDDTLARWVDEGPDWYASVTWEDPNASDPLAMRYAMGWVNNWRYANQMPTEVGYFGQQSLTRQIRLQSINGVSILTSAPIASQDNVFSQVWSGQDQTISDAVACSLPVLRLKAYKLAASFAPSSGAWPAQIIVDFRSGNGFRARFVMTPATGTITFDRSCAAPMFIASDAIWDLVYPVTMPDGFGSQIDIVAYADTQSIEVFVNGIAFTSLAIPPDWVTGLSISAVQGSCEVTGLSIRGFA
ncbi:putative phage tail protein [Asaia sp. HN010]|uniref:putative phage tail protein n=1 Tax=Asaia sp. HN010 TaxID=3081233 RepID=UPI0030196846